MPLDQVVLEGHALAPRTGEQPYLYLPFDVPSGCGRIDVRYAFGRQEGPADAAEPDVLDLGLVDPAFGSFPSQAGFRGWSGSARRAVFLARDDATPGYIPGYLPAGRWHVVLGLARVGDAPCPYRVEVELRGEGELGTAELPSGGGPVPAQPGDGGEPVAAAPPANPPPAPRRRGWYPGDLQSHTHHSDAKGSLADLRAAAKARGLAFLAVTDHNTVSHHRFLPAMSDASLLLVPGMEVTTYHGHANVWGADGWVDFRVTNDDELRTLIEQVHARGGLFSVNHPKQAPGCIGCDWEHGLVEGIDCLEAWQGPWAFGNWESLERYDRLLRGGRRVTLVGGSDRHQPGWPDQDPVELQVGSPTTWLYLEELSVAAVLGALREGRASVSEAPDGPRLEIWLDEANMGGVVLARGERHEARAVVHGARGDRLRWIGPAGVLREAEIASEDFLDRFSLELPSGFLRAEVCAGASLGRLRSRVEALAAARGLPWGLSLEAVFAQPYRRALSNPVYVQGEG